MGSHRAPGDLKLPIIKGTQHLIAEGGMSNFSFPKLTAETGIKAPTVYEYYESKEKLLLSCYLQIDGEIAELIAKIIESIPLDENDSKKLNEYCQLLWMVYWKYLLSDHDRTLFYWRFYNSEFYTSDVTAMRTVHFKRFIEFVNMLGENYKAFENHNIMIMLANMVDATISAAVKVINGTYENNDITVNTVYRMIFQPVFSVFDIDVYK